MTKEHFPKTFAEKFSQFEGKILNYFEEKIFKDLQAQNREFCRHIFQGSRAYWKISFKELPTLNGNFCGKCFQGLPDLKSLNL